MLPIANTITSSSGRNVAMNARATPFGHRQPRPGHAEGSVEGDDGRERKRHGREGGEGLRNVILRDSEIGSAETSDRLAGAVGHRGAHLAKTEPEVNYPKTLVELPGQERRND